MMDALLSNGQVSFLVYRRLMLAYALAVAPPSLFASPTTSNLCPKHGHG